ncbi:hypothetical protein ACWELB_39315 [Streptomyces asiaticus]
MTWSNICLPGEAEIRSPSASSSGESAASPRNKHAEVRPWAARRAGLPAYGSWLNWIESEFAALRRFALNGIDHQTHDEQNAATADGYLQASVFGLILALLAMNYGIATGSRAMHDDERERRQHPGRPARGAGRLCHGPIRPGIKIP